MHDTDFWKQSTAEALKCPQHSHVDILIPTVVRSGGEALEEGTKSGGRTLMNEIGSLIT